MSKEQQQNLEGCRKKSVPCLPEAFIRQNLRSQKGKRASRTVHRQATGLASPDPALQEALPCPPQGSPHLELTLQPRASSAEERALALGELCLSSPSGRKASHSPSRDGPDHSFTCRQRSPASRAWFPTCPPPHTSRAAEGQGCPAPGQDPRRV